eukprot:4076582-Prorocentrum_lima.AAC.1
MVKRPTLVFTETVDEWIVRVEEPAPAYVTKDPEATLLWAIAESDIEGLSIQAKYVIHTQK